MSERNLPRRRGVGAVRGPAGVLTACVMLTACGGGGGDTGGGTPNTAPVADAGLDRTVVELTTVQLSGSATDANAGDTLSFAWSQTGGATVMLDNASMAQASFEAPDVAAGAPEILTFRLTVSDNAGGTDSDDVRITVQEPGPVVTVSGVARYEFVPSGPTCGLNYAATELRPIRQATVQIRDAATDAVLGSDTTDDSGNYSITVDAGRSVFLRVRAELKRSGTPSWDVEVRDNTSVTTAPLDERPLYVLDTGDFDSGAVDQTLDVIAATGWDTTRTSYVLPRAAAPFAILDSIYDGMLLVLSADATTTFPALDAFWSINNSLEEGTGNFDDDVASGEIGTSFYSSGINSLFLLGAADQDTEEFDDHVIIHEWGHYFEDVFSRSDSIGGPHSTAPDRLDMRVAFGEGWATALAGIALESANYCDSQGPAQANGLRIDIESFAPNPRGWFNEFSVMALIYDLWDTDPDLGGADTDSIGFEPIFETMTTLQAVTAAHTSIFTFTEGLRNTEPTAAAFIDALRVEHDINGAGIYGDNESNDSSSGMPEDVLPVYTLIQPNGVTHPDAICSNRQFDSSFDGNKLSEYRFLRMTIVNPSQFTFDIVTRDETTSQLPPDDPSDERDQSDPDILIRLNGVIQNAIVGGEPQGLSGEANRENFTTPNVLAAGDYVMDLVEFRHTDDMSNPNFPEQSCFDVTVTPFP